MPVSREDRWLSLLLLLSLALTLLFVLINAAAFRFTGISYFPRESTPLICLGLQFAYFDKIYGHVSPRAGFLIRSAAFYGLANIALAFFVSGASGLVYQVAWQRILVDHLGCIAHWSISFSVCPGATG